MSINLNQNTADITQDMWKEFSKEQKKALLKSLDLDQSWAETKTVQEMVNRGGGIVAKTLHGLVKKHKEVHPEWY